MTFVEAKHEGAVSTLTINRPDKLNALSQQVLGDLKGAIHDLSRRDDVRATSIHLSSLFRVATAATSRAFVHDTSPLATARSSFGKDRIDSASRMNCDVFPDEKPSASVAYCWIEAYPS